MKIDVHQIYFDPAQLPGLDPAFLPFDACGRSHEGWYEWWHFKHAYHSGMMDAADYTGLVSWKFSRKTGVTGEGLFKFIRANPGYDVYFVDPFPDNRDLFRNVWLSGDYQHPGLLRIAQKILNELEIDLDLKRIENDAASTLHCNYFVANKVFWEKYMALTTRIVDLVESEPRFKKLISVDSGYTGRIDYRAFVMERMFSTLLVLDPAIRSLAYAEKHEIRQNHGFISPPVGFVDRLKHSAVGRAVRGSPLLRSLRTKLRSFARRGANSGSAV